MNKARLDFSRGAVIRVGDRLFKVTDDAFDLDHVEARDLATGRIENVLIDSIEAPLSEVDSAPYAPALSELDSDHVQQARTRLAVIRPLLESPRRRRADIDKAAEALGVGKTTIYRWMHRYAHDGRLTSLTPTKRPGGRGKSRLSPELDGIITSVISEYLSPRQVSVRAAVREVKRRCHNAGLTPPHENTVRARIRAIPEEESLTRRGHKKKALEKFTPRPDHYGDGTHPLAVIQIDHTQLDIWLVDEQYRLPLKRPWITVAMDVFSRMVVGFYISFDNPGALGTGLCIARSVLRKNEWLSRLDVKHEWPCYGFPSKIHMDNAREFRGEMLRLACEQHGVGIEFRMVGVSSMGGHIERLLGTITSKRIQSISGVARKPAARGSYDPKEQAVMTLPELEQTLTEFITGVYHKEYHSEIGTTPLKRWSDAILGNEKQAGIGTFPLPADEERFRIDFMPVVKRTVQAYGVQIDEVLYYGDVLRPFIHSKRKGGNLHVFHRDPRDISKIYFWHPEIQQYFEIPYRNATHPPISVWELREVRRHLETQGRANVDEHAIFETYNRLREHEERAHAQTAQARRKTERRATLTREAKERPQKTSNVVPIQTRRFSKIEPLEMEDEL